MKIKVATGKSVYKSQIKTQEITVKQLYSKLEFPDIRGQKDGPYFIFASFNNKRRTAASVDQYYGATLDLDDVELSIKEIKKAFRTISFCIYTTFNHKQPGKGSRYRIVIPYKKPISPERHRDVATCLLFKLGASNIGSDAISQRALSRPMYFPACSKKSEKHFEYYVNDKRRFFNPDTAKLSAEQEFELAESNHQEQEKFDINESYEEGGRNDALARLVGKFIRNGMDLKLAHQSAYTWAQTNCEPPLTKNEVSTIVDSVYNSHKRNSKDSGWGFDELKRRIENSPKGDEAYEELIRLISGSYKKLSKSEQERLIKKVQQKTQLPIKVIRDELNDAVEEYKEKSLAEDDEKEELSATSLKKEFKNWIYMRRDDRLFNTLNGLVFKVEGFNRAHSAKIEKGSLLQILLKYRCIQQADMMMFNPEEDTIFKMDHITYVNSYIQPELFPIPGDVTPMLDHFEYLFPDEKERNIILDYFAFIIQKPGFKVRWMPIIKGGKGIGKSMIVDHVLAPLLGRRNTFAVNTKMIKSDFNSWQLDSQLVVFHELKIGDSRREKMNLTDSLKDFIADNYITAHRKGLDEYQALNKANVIGLTNHEDAIMMTTDERRFGMFRSDAQPKSFGYYEKLVKWFEKNHQEMLDYFLERDISKFNHARAPETSMTKEVKEGSVMWPHNIIQMGLDDPNHYFNKHGYCTYKGILEFVRHHSSGKDLLTLSNMETMGSSQSYILINAIKDLGFRKWQHVGRKTDRLSIKGVSERIWVSPKFSRKRSKTPRDIRVGIIRNEKRIYEVQE